MTTRLLAQNAVRLLVFLATATSLCAVERFRHTAVTNYTGYIIEADAGTGLPGYDRDRIRTEVIVESDNSGAATGRSYTNVLTARLLDANGMPQPLILPGGTTNNSLQVSNVINAPAGSVLFSTNGAALRPAARLSPYLSYRVQWILNSPLAPPNTTTNDALRTYKQFTNSISGDPSYNVIVEASAPQWVRLTAVATDTNRNGFLVDVPITVHRFDEFQSPAPITNTIGVRTVFELRSTNTGTVIPLSVTQSSLHIPVAGYASSAPRIPAVVTRTNRIELIPAAGVQLDSVQESYRLVVMVSHTNAPGAGAIPDHTVQTVPTSLFHFSGRILFGAVEGRFTQLSSDPQITPTVGNPGSYPAILRVINQSGLIVGATGRTFGGGEPLGVYLQADGTSIFTTNNVGLPGPGPQPNVRSVVVTTPPIDAASINGVNYIRAGTKLDHEGGHADVLAVLPAGFGYTTTISDSRRFKGTVIFSNAPLVAALEPQGPLNLPGPLYASCDSHPLVFAAAALVWSPQAGAFSLAAAAATHVAFGEFNKLHGNRPGNYNHYRDLALALTPLVTIGTSNGFARLFADLNYAENGGFTAHFPYGSAVKWTNGGQLRIRNGTVVQTNGGSFLAGIQPVPVDYARDCAGCGSTNTTTNTTLLPTNQKLWHTLDGGLIAVGSPLNGALAWGYIAVSNDFANRTEPFPLASFHMPGSSLAGGEINAHPDAGGAILSLTGVDANNLNYRERPDLIGSTNLTAYQAGLADYAGMNFAVGIDSGRFATSIVAGVRVDHWPLSGRSKYYVRPAGVTGIHEAAPGGFPSNTRLYGYETTLLNYTLSFLDGENLESKTLGSLALPYPSSFTQDFSNLRFSCPGGVLGANLPPGSTGLKRLSYWSADFTPKSFTFASPDECDSTEGYLVMGIEGWASQFARPLLGSLGFKTDGNLIHKTFADNVGLTDVDSRLKLANNATFAGPGGETYHFTPVADAYLNSYGARPNTGSGSSLGWWNLAGTLDVPFFEDLKVHLQTGAQKTNFTAPLYLMGGWPRTEGRPNYGWRDASNLDYFNASYFDPNNRGWPTGLSRLDDYRSSVTETNHPRAQRLWLDVVEFDYPLSWSSGARSFSSFAPKEADFLILRAAHQVPYMSSEKLELTFGLEYDGLPQINLANLALDLLDEQSDIARALVDATSEAARDTVMDGLQDLDDLLADLPGTFFDPLLDALLDPTIAALQQQLGIAWSNSPAGTFNSAAKLLCDQYLRGTAGAVSTNVAAQLRKLSLLTTNTDGAVHDLNMRLSRVEAMIETNRGIIVESPPGSGQRTVGANLIRAVVGRSAPQFVVNVEGAILDEMLAVADPTFDELDSTLAALSSSVTATRQGLTAAGGLGREMNDAVLAGQSQIDFATSNACVQLTLWLESIEPDYLSYSPEEIEAEIRRQIADAFYGQQLTADLQTILRSWFHELDSALQEAIDSAFAQFNRTMRDLISQSLAEVDDTINPLVGDVNAVLGAGRINGYAHFNADSLDEARIDVRWRWNVPDEAKFDGYALIRELNSKGDDTCAAVAGSITDVTIGATDVGMEWIAPNLRVNVAGRFSFDSNARLIGMGGSFETVGEFSLEESFTVTDLSATAYFGATENYLGASAGMRFNSYEAGGALFFGHACTLDPIRLIDPDIGALIKDGAFTGAYGFARVSVPITETVLGIPCSCLFCITASMGAGAGYRFEGHEFIGKIEAGVSGDALCLVNIYGEITLAGSVSASGVRFHGSGEVGGCIGHSPLEICHDFRVTLGFENGKWSVDHQEK